MTVADFSTDALRRELDRRGYTTSAKKDFPWETPKEFSQRHGYGATWLTTKRKRCRTFPLFECEKGKTGRVIRLRSNPELESFAAKPTKP